MKPLPSSLPELTSIRAIAALVVVLFHMFFSEQTTASPIRNLLADGHLGVDLFFLLSGFILTHVYLEQWNQGRFSYSHFLVNRFARIYPLHLFILVLFICAYGIAERTGVETSMEGKNWSHFKWHVTLLHAWGTTDGHSWNFPSWSVSAEMFAYLSFPIALWLSHRLPTKINLIVFVLLFGLGAIVSQTFLGKPITKLMFDFGILRVATEFLLGIATYLILQKQRLPDKAVRPVIYICLLLISGFSMAQFHEVLLVLLIAILLAALAHLCPQARPNILRSRLLVYLGEISYSTYMIHILALMTVPALGAKLGLESNHWINVATVFVIYSSSAVLYHAVELPMRKIIRNRFNKYMMPRPGT